MLRRTFSTLAVAACLPSLLAPPVRAQDWRDKVKEIRIGLMGGENTQDRLVRFDGFKKLLEELSYSASDTQEKTLVIDAAYVDERLGELAINEDLSRYVL